MAGILDDIVGGIEGAAKAVNRDVIQPGVHGVETAAKDVNRDVIHPISEAFKGNPLAYGNLPHNPTQQQPLGVNRPGALGPQLSSLLRAPQREVSSLIYTWQHQGVAKALEAAAPMVGGALLNFVPVGRIAAPFLERAGAAIEGGATAEAAAPAAETAVADLSRPALGAGTPTGPRLFAGAQGEAPTLAGNARPFTEAVTGPAKTPIPYTGTTEGLGASQAPDLATALNEGRTSAQALREQSGVIDALRVPAKAVRGAFAAGVQRPFNATIGRIPIESVAGWHAGAYASGPFINADTWKSADNPGFQAKYSLGSVVSQIPLLDKVVPHSLLYDIPNIAVALAPDPTGAIGRVIGKANSADGLVGWAGHFKSGVVPTDGKDLFRVMRQYPQKQAPYRSMEGMTAGQIAVRYPEIAPLAERLEEAGGHLTGQEGVDARLGVMANAIDASNFPKTMLPTDRLLTGVGKAILQSKMGKLETNYPEYLNELTQQLEHQHIVVGDVNALPAMHKALMLSGLDYHSAADVINTLIHTKDPQQWINTYRNGVVAGTRNLVGDEAWQKGMLGQVGNQLVSSVQRKIDEMLNIRDRAQTGIYDHNIDHQPIPGVWDKSANEGKGGLRSVGVIPEDAAQLRFPDFGELRNLRTQLEAHLPGMPAYHLAKMGQFIDYWVNKVFFRPLALLTGGFAGRVATNEAIANMFRIGHSQFSMSHVADSMARQGFKLASAEEKGVAYRAIHSVLLGWDEGAAKAFPTIKRTDYLDAAVHQYMAHGKDYLGSLSAFHGGGLLREVDAKDQARADIKDSLAHQNKSRNVVLGDAFVGRAIGDDGSFLALSNRLNAYGREDSTRATAAVYQSSIKNGLGRDRAYHDAVDEAERQIEAMPTMKRENMLRSQFGLQSSTDLPTRDWAHTMVQGMEGLVHGPNRKLNEDFLSGIVDGSQRTWKELKKAYPPEKYGELPPVIAGREMIPSDHFQGWINRIANTTHGHVLSPVINYLSRRPLYIATFAQERKAYAEAVASRQLSQDAADVLAETATIKKAIKWVHNPADRTKWAEMIKGVAPFYFAQEQSWRRMGRLFLENPGAFEQYSKAMLGLQDWAVHLKDKQGTPYVAIPGTEWITRAETEALSWMGLHAASPVSLPLTGSVDVAKSLNPFAAEVSQGDTQPNTGSVLWGMLRPAWGPTVTFPANIAAHALSTTHPAVASAIGTAVGPIPTSEPLLYNLIPNTPARKLLVGVLGTLGLDHNDFTSSYVTVMLSNIREAAIHGQLPPADATPHQRETFLSNIRIQTGLEWTVQTLLGFASPVSTTLGRAGLKFEQQFQDDLKNTSYDYTRAIRMYLKQNPTGAPFIIASSKAPGMSVPETTVAGQWIRDNSYTIEKYSRAAAALMPQSARLNGGFDLSTEALQLADGLRTKDTPDQFLTQLYINSGNHYYYDHLKPERDQLLRDHPDMKQQIDRGFQILLDRYKGLHPEWWSYFHGQVGATNRQEEFNQMKQMVNDPQVPETIEKEHLRQLVAFYQMYSDEKAQVSQYDYKALQQGANWWRDRMTTLAKNWTDLAPVITQTFQYMG